MRRVQPHPTFAGIDFSWTLEPSSTGDSDVGSIALRIEEGSCSLLRTLQAINCWRHALGYSEPVIDNIINQHIALAYRIRGYLQYKPDFRQKYIQLETVSHLISTLDSLTDTSRSCRLEAH